MANLQVTFDQEQIQEALFGDRGPVAVLMESVLNQVLPPEGDDGPPRCSPRAAHKRPLRVP
jgi:hypothetical protein